MKEATRDLPARDFVMPGGVVKRTIDSRTGLLVGEAYVPSAGPKVDDDARAPETALASTVEQMEAPEAEEGELPPGAIEEVFLEGTEPMITADETAPPPLELLEGAGGLGP